MARLVAGDTLGPYSVLAPLGAGAMGEVYRARDTRLQRDVAIKTLPDVFAFDDERLRRFEREAQVLASLNHPNIAAIYGVEEARNAPAIVMELVEGPTLADRLQSGSLAVEDALRVAVQIADALEAAHEQGVVHRDLKPGNLKVRADGTVKVLDFGLAKIQPVGGVGLDPIPATMTAAGTRAGVVIGTAAYMSPEQARGRAVDRRTDIWAFGCVVFELLSGRRAFPGESLSDTVANVLQRDPDWTSLPPVTPSWLRQLLRRCLQKDPRKRLRDIGDARLEIEERLAGVITAEPTDTSARSGRRIPVWSAIGLAAVAAAVAFGVARASRPPADNAPRFERFIPFVATPAHESGPAISPDGKWVAYLSNARGPTDVWVKFVAGGDAANLTAASGLEVQSQDYIGGLDVSPDGTLISFGAAPAGTSQLQMTTWVIAAPLGGVPRRFLGASDLGARWSPDGSHICYTHAGGSSGDALWIADADGSNAREVVKSQGGRHIHWSRWSHDGHSVYFDYGFYNFNNGPTEIFRVSSEGGTAEPVVKTARVALFPFPSADGQGFFFSSNRDGVNLALWWHDLSRNRDVRLTNGVGDYSEPYESADGRRLVGTFTNMRQSIVRVSLSSGAPPVTQALTDGTTGDLDPAISPDGTRIVFSSSRTGNRNLWSAGPDLTHAAPLTAGNAIDERPAFSPDGRQVAFVSDRGGRRGIWTVDADGGQPREIIADNVLDTISWAPDGQKIVYAVGGEDAPSLRVVATNDGKVTRLVTPAGAVAPVWSPVADLIAYLEPSRGRGTFLRLVDSRGRPQQTALSDVKESFSNGFVAWSPDGRRLAAVTLPGNLNGAVWLVDSGTAGPTRKLIDLPAEQFVRGISWSRDGNTILVGTISSSGDIYLAERVGSPR